ncbi:MAG: tripartite tricarboxylate transporter TctB family protein [Syntrophales bacterium]
MQKMQQCAALCFVLFSALVVWGSLNMEYYTKLGPGAGFFPLWLGVAMGVLSLVWLVRVSRRTGKPPNSAALPDRAGIVRILAITASLVAAALVMNFLGFQVAMFLLLVFLLLVLGRQPLWLTVIIALAGSVGVYRVFVSYLDVQLPAASLAFLTRLGL